MSDTLLQESAPHDLSVSTTGKVMRILMLSLIPALVAHVYFYGYGIIITMIIALISCVTAEAVCLRLRKRKINLLWRDSSAMVTAVLLAFTLPPLTPWYLTVIGSLFAIVIAKQIFGGLGQNLFNPAMAGFVFLLISAPLPLTTYVNAMPDATDIITPARASSIIFNVNRDAVENEINSRIKDQDYLNKFIKAEQLKIADGYTGSTILVDAKHEQPAKSVEIFARNNVPDISSYTLFARIVIGLTFLLGGAVLLFKEIIDFRIPLAFITVSSVLTAVFHFCAPELYLSTFYHLFFGATIFGAFYIMTDPVTAVSKPSGAYIYGAVIAVLFTIIRNLGGYPDAVAFSVLLGNAVAPLIFVMTRRREFGQGFTPENIND